MALRQFSHLAFDPWQLQCSSRVGDSDAIPLLRPLANDDILLFTSANSSSVNGSTSGSNTSDAELELDVDALAVMLDSPAAKRRRKRTYDTRKDEIDSLSKAAARLGAKLDFLKHRAGVQDAHSVAQKERCNATLREVLRTQQLQLAGVRSMMSVDPSYHALSPVSTRIHLERDLAQRRRALRAIKFQKLHDARRFLEKRTQFSRHTARLSESMRFETGDGEACVVKFDIVPLHSATSVKHAFDAVMFYFANLEICSTEALGDVTVREENVESGSSSRGCGTDDARGGGGGGITQHRFMRHHRHHDAIQIETNNVVFSEHTPSHRCAQTGECREEAIVVTDFVDQDDLYPYRPRERIRKDITSILHMRSFATRPRTSTANVSTSAASESNRRVNADDVGDPESACEQVVVLTMWYQATLRRGECAVPPEREREIIEDTDRVFKATLSSVRSLLGPTHTQK